MATLDALGGTSSLNGLEVTRLLTAAFFTGVDDPGSHVISRSATAKGIKNPRTILDLQVRPSARTSAGRRTIPSGRCSCIADPPSRIARAAMR